jgi:hypothetical protein
LLPSLHDEIINTLSSKAFALASTKPYKAREREEKRERKKRKCRARMKKARIRAFSSLCRVTLEARARFQGPSPKPLDSMSWQFSPGSFALRSYLTLYVLAIFLLSCPGFPVLTVLCCQFCSVFSILLALSWLSCPGCSVLAVIFCLSRSGCTVLAVFVLAMLFWLYSPFCPAMAVLS